MLFWCFCFPCTFMWSTSVRHRCCQWRNARFLQQRAPFLSLTQRVMGISAAENEENRDSYKDTGEPAATVARPILQKKAPMSAALKTASLLLKWTRSAANCGAEWTVLAPSRVIVATRPFMPTCLLRHYMSHLGLAKSNPKKNLCLPCGHCPHRHWFCLAFSKDGGLFCITILCF